MKKTQPVKISTGIYTHFKGGSYAVFGICVMEDIDSNQDDVCVIYKPLYNESGYWVRPYDMFFETIFDAGHMKSRFSLKTSAVYDTVLDGVRVTHSETLDKFNIETKDGCLIGVK